MIDPTGDVTSLAIAWKWSPDVTLSLPAPERAHYVKAAAAHLEAQTKALASVTGA